MATDRSVVMESSLQSYLKVRYPETPCPLTFCVFLYFPVFSFLLFRFCSYFLCCIYLFVSSASFSFFIVLLSHFLFQSFSGTTAFLPGPRSQPLLLLSSASPISRVALSLFTLFLLLSPYLLFLSLSLFTRLPRSGYYSRLFLFLLFSISLLHYFTLYPIS